MRKVRVIAHRGASFEFPENTLAAFDAALREGCDAIELDVQLSRDGVPVVYHDRTLVRAGGGRRRVGRLDLDALRRLDAGAWLDSRFRGLHIPTLAEVLDRYGGRVDLLVEMKNRSRPASAERTRRLAHSVCALIGDRGLHDHCSVLSFDPEALDVCARRLPRLSRTLNLKPPRRLDPHTRRRLEAVEAVGADVRTLTPGFASAVRRLGLSLLVFTCNTPRRVAKALGCEPDGVMTDRPLWLARQLAERQTDAS